MRPSKVHASDNENTELKAEKLILQLITATALQTELWQSNWARAKRDISLSDKGPHKAGIITGSQNLAGKDRQDRTERGRFRSSEYLCWYPDVFINYPELAVVRGCMKLKEKYYHSPCYLASRENHAM